MPTLTLIDPRGLVAILAVVGLLVLGGMMLSAMPATEASVAAVTPPARTLTLLDTGWPEGGEFPFVDPAEIALHLETVSAMYEARTVEEVLRFPLPTGDVEVKLSRHARTKHAKTAPIVYDLIRRGQFKLYYSGKLGQFLALVEYQGLCGGQVWFIDPTGSPHIGYERTAFGFQDCRDSCAYWQREIIYGCYKLVGGVGLAA